MQKLGSRLIATIDNGGAGIEQAESSSQDLDPCLVKQMANTIGQSADHVRLEPLKLGRVKARHGHDTLRCPVRTAVKQISRFNQGFAGYAAYSQTHAAKALFTCCVDEGYPAPQPRSVKSCHVTAWPTSRDDEIDRFGNVSNYHLATRTPRPVAFATPYR